MGISLNVDVNNENEFNQQLQLYLSQGYRMQSNFNGTAILKKKSYNMGVLIVLIIFLFPVAIIYYLLATDDIVTIRNNNGQTAGNTSNANSTTQSFDLYCEECGHGLFNDSKFCPNCGRDLSVSIEDTVESEPEESEGEVLKCKNCGKELTEENNFCPKCGEKITAPDEE